MSLLATVVEPDRRESALSHNSRGRFRADKQRPGGKLRLEREHEQR